MENAQLEEKIKENLDNFFREWGENVWMLTVFFLFLLFVAMLIACFLAPFYLFGVWGLVLALPVGIIAFALVLTIVGCIK